MTLGLSVGQRLLIVLALQVIAVAAIVLVTFATARNLMREADHVNRFTLQPIAALAAAIDGAAQLQDLLERGTERPADRFEVERLLDEQYRFMQRYRAEWATADSSSEDAAHFRGQLREVGQLGLVDRELGTMLRVDRALDVISANSSGPLAEGAVGELRRSLYSLLTIDMAFSEVAHSIMRTIRLRSRRDIILVAVVGLAAPMLMVWRVREDISARMKRMVAQVRRFREEGTFERVGDVRNDDIALLGNALDTGLAAMHDREQDRERFLAIAAHELRTPLTSIVGFTQAAAERPERTDIAARALASVRRQSARLERLVEDMLLAARARSGTLPFHPKPLDVRALAERVASELMTQAPGRTITIVAPGETRAVADEQLLSHALWSFIGFAAGMTPMSEVVTIELERTTRLHVRGTIPASALLPAGRDYVFEPFGLVEYEGGGGVRRASGLFLAREIARIHGGGIQLIEREGDLLLDMQLAA